ncbi:MAG TPA: hypothetical protein VHQ66_13965 [Myxococcota bacterium]|nr:hypothetical protein [Myxococcota bacterium]
MARQATGRGRDERQPGERDIGGNQGEGNREADRRYREDAKRFAESGRSEEAARDAADDLDDDEPGDDELEGADERDEDYVDADGDADVDDER